MLLGAFWLDFFDDLLSADHKNLNAEYTMDGTHLRPNYVSLIEQALQKYFASTLTGATIGRDELKDSAAAAARKLDKVV